ncbi:Uncharacterized membrane protein YvbJ [Salinibacillus kushneri]|uniref:Uncharacterized membrane protein YvbJ n=1 Tax=Salinibacillus kushneri TaxID=237682 RepID=A0A1I0HBC6_9BACI|nr:zinc-ribbon domain-containing protein [Salinibacillus kushneri]SET81087.1 Uncharacterized membrane protein YvbJ [Salinibacillus kushneri]
MGYCKECGHPLKADARFCSECGTEVSASQPAYDFPQQNKKSIQSQSKPKKPWTKRQKLVSLGIGIVVLLLVIGYQAGTALTDKDRLIEKFDEAISEQDQSQLAKLLYSNDSELSITEENVEPLMTYFSENPDYHESVIHSLKEQAEALNQGQDEQGHNGVFKLEQNGKTAFLFDRYEITITPFYFTVATNLVDTAIYLEDEEVAMSDSDNFEQEVGPVLPGIYQLKAEYENDFVQLENSNQIELINVSDQNLYTEVYLEAGDVYLNTGYDQLASQVNYYINEEEIESSEDGAQFGPISLNGSATAHAELEFPWGKVETEKAKIDKKTINLAVDSPFSEDVKTDMMNAIHTYAQDRAKAYRELDESNFSHISNNLLEVHTEEISDMKEDEVEWIGTYQKSSFDLDSFDIQYTDNTYTASVEARLQYDSTTANTNEEEVETEETEYDRGYELIYDEENDEWIVNDYYNLFWGFSADNVKELTPSEEE